MKLSNNHPHDVNPYEKLLKHYTPAGLYPALNHGWVWIRLRHRRGLLALNRLFPRLTNYRVDVWFLSRAAYNKRCDPCMTQCNVHP